MTGFGHERIRLGEAARGREAIHTPPDLGRFVLAQVDAEERADLPGHSVVGDRVQIRHGNEGRQNRGTVGPGLSLHPHRYRQQFEGIDHLAVPQEACSGADTSGESTPGM